MNPRSRGATGWVLGLALLTLVAGCSHESTRLPARAARYPARITLDYRVIGPPTMDRGVVVLPVGRKAGGEADRVVVLTAAAPTPKVVARTAFSSGFINWAVTTGGWVVWVDQSAVQSDVEGDVLWRIWARRLTGGAPVLLSSNGSRPDPYVPWLAAGEGSVAWATAERDRHARQWIWKVGENQPRTLLRFAELSPDIESVADGKLVYLGPSSLPHTGRTIGGDCWALDLGGGTPIALTHTGLAMDCRAGDGTLVWYTHVDPKRDGLPPEKLYDDPWGVWTKRLDDLKGAGTRLSKGYSSGGAPAIGKGFIVWPGTDRDDTSYLLLQGGRRRGLDLPETARDVVADGDTLVWTDSGENGHEPAVLHFDVLEN